MDQKIERVNGHLKIWSVINYTDALCRLRGVLFPKLIYRVKYLDVCLCTGVWQHNLLD